MIKDEYEILAFNDLQVAHAYLTTIYGVMTSLREEFDPRGEELSTPYIGVHIRRGDFLQFQSDEHFKNNGNTKTPDFYFIDLINSIRKYTNLIIPVKIFSDGYKAELQKSGAFENEIVTEIVPTAIFYEAEKYHQNYFNQNGNPPYCQFVIRPKVEKFQKAFKNKLK